MPTIKILDPITTDQIAAGEVVERPASVVKELIENSLDAGASVIDITVTDGGIGSIEISDNGSGMDKEDIYLSCERHATSKLGSVEDFLKIRSMGFRGEALASIAAVSKLKISSRKILSDKGYYLEIEGGKRSGEGSSGMNEGTIVQVKSLFYNTPARYKFLKQDSTEISYITDIVERFVLSRPDVSFKLTVNGKQTLHSPGNNDLKSAIFSIYGSDIAENILPVELSVSGTTVSGYIGKPVISRKTRKNQSFFVNNRYIKSALLSAAIDEAYKTLVMKHKFPFCVVNIDIHPADIDINVHPQKTQVKFKDEKNVFRIVMHAVKEALSNTIDISEIIKEEPIKYPLQYEEGKNDLKENSVPLSDVVKDKVQFNPYTQRENRQIPLSEDKTEEVKRTGGDPDLISDIANMKFIGSLFNTFLIFESGEKVVLLDQHAAHERIIFEKLVTSYKNKKINKQILISPEIVELTVSDMELAQENLDLLEELGFECEKFGEKSLLIRTVPMSENELKPDSAVKSILDSIENNDLSDISSALYTMACKAAVKGNDELQREEVDQLISSLTAAERNTHCPHGRPVAVKITRYEIEKWFKRIVT